MWAGRLGFSSRSVQHGNKFFLLPKIRKGVAFFGFNARLADSDKTYSRAKGWGGQLLQEPILSRAYSLHAER